MEWEKQERDVIVSIIRKYFKRFATCLISETVEITQYLQLSFSVRF